MEQMIHASQMQVNNNHKSAYIANLLQLPKLNVAGSNPVSRSMLKPRKVA